MSDKIDRLLDGPGQMRAIRKWSTEVLIKELRDPRRAGLGVEDYRLILAEGMARLLENLEGKDGPG